MAGEYFSLQMGFSYTEVLDPVSQTSLPVVSILKNMLGMMVFLVSGAYRLVFESIAYSFEHIRIINFSNEVNSAIIKTFEYAVGAMFVVAFKISLPVLGVLLLVTIAESLMGKAAPQMNVMQMSFPAKIAAGMIVMVIIMPVIVEQMEEGFNLSFEKVDRLIISWPK
jgi:flagellar biosynthetic protein FliR